MKIWGAAWNLNSFPRFDCLNSCGKKSKLQNPTPKIQKTRLHNWKKWAYHIAVADTFLIANGSQAVPLWFIHKLILVKAGLATRPSIAEWQFQNSFLFFLRWPKDSNNSNNSDPKYKNQNQGGCTGKIHTGSTIINLSNINLDPKTPGLPVQPF